MEIIEILFESLSKFVMQHAEELPGVEHEEDHGVCGTRLNREHFMSPCMPSGVVPSL